MYWLNNVNISFNVLVLSSQRIINIIIFIYLFIVLSRYHVINYLALLLGLTLITSIYRTFDPLIKTKLKVKPNCVVAKINILFCEHWKKIGSFYEIILGVWYKYEHS